MTILTIRPLLYAITIILLLGTAAAADINASNEDELNAYIMQLIAEQQGSQAAQQPVVVQIKSDESLNQKIDLIVSELGALKQTDDRLQEKFSTLAMDIDTKLQASEERIASRQEAKLVEESEKQTKELKVYVREQTNPIRMNLPSIGAFIMAAALFLILISRTYNFKGKEVQLVVKPESQEKKYFDEATEKFKKEKEEQEKKEFDKVLKKAKGRKSKRRKRKRFARVIKSSGNN